MVLKRKWLSVASTVALVSVACAFGSPASAADAGHSGYVKPHITHAKYGLMRLVVPLTTDSKKVQGKKLRNIQNGLDAARDWGGKFKVKVVLYAKGLTLLENPAPAFKAEIDKLRSQGVRFEICNNSLREQNVNFHSLYGVTDADIVPSGFAEVVYLQQKRGYSVDPVN